MKSFSCTVEDNLPSGLRLDRYIAEYLKLLSRSQIKARNLEARLNGKAVKISRPLAGREYLELIWEEAESPFLIPEKMPLDIIYEDTKVIVINKPQGLVVHPGAGNRQGTLANALLYRNLEKKEAGAGLAGWSLSSPCSGGQRPGIVHRLDKDTSGVIIAAWDDSTLAFLSEQFKARKVQKTYAALVRGCPGEPSGRIEKKITRSRRDRKTFTVSDTEGRASLTFYKVVRSWGDFSLLLIRPKTGRTHQIRVHLKYLGFPILGDPLYGRDDNRFKNTSLMLHAKSLSLVLPDICSSQKGEQVTFRAPLPSRFREIMSLLERKRR